MAMRAALVAIVVALAGCGGPSAAGSSEASYAINGSTVTCADPTSPAQIQPSTDPTAPPTWFCYWDCATHNGVSGTWYLTLIDHGPPSGWEIIWAQGTVSGCR